MSRITPTRSVALFSMALVIAISSVVGLFRTEDVSAANRPAGYSFFNNAYVGSSTRAVIWYTSSPYQYGDSLPYFYSKTAFVNHIKWLLGGDGSSWQWRNQTGAEYIVQRMRAGSDFSRPNAADVADWEARVMQPNVTIQNEVVNDTQTSGFVTLGGYSSGTDTVGGRDDVWYTKTSNINYDQVLTFRQDGVVVFRIRYNCGNPLGNFAGLTAQNFDLTPSISGTPSGAAESGTDISLSPRVDNTGTTQSASAEWQVTRFQVPPGGAYPGPATNDTLPLTYFNTAVTTDEATIASGDEEFDTGLSDALPVGVQTLGDLPVGTRVCYALSVQPVRHDNTNWRHSTPFCLVISKKPKVVVEGSDVLVGRGATSQIVTSTTRKGGLSYGSWGEYGVAASGTIAGMGSGAGYSGGNPSTLFCSVSLLTFTNSGPNACGVASIKGNYSLTGTLPNLSARFSQGTALTGANINLTSLANGVYTRNGNGPVNLNAGGGDMNIGVGRWVVINAPNSTVTIGDDILYTNAALSSLADIPQIVIIANQIRIEGDVSQVDAWLAATGTTGNLITCSDVANASNLNATRCAAPLTVNGPVMARHIMLYRTAGSGTAAASDDPAERFNLRPDAYLWATYFNSQANRIQTVTTRELPPRF